MGSFQPFENAGERGGAPGKIDASLNEMLRGVKWGEYKMGDLFAIQRTLSFNSNRLVDGTEYDYVTRTSCNQGILRETGFVNKENLNPAGCFSLGLLQMNFFYRRKRWYAGQFVRKVIPRFPLTENSVLYFSALLNKQREKLSAVLVRNVDETFRNLPITLPVTQSGQMDVAFIEDFIEKLKAGRIAEMEAERADELSAYLTVIGQNSCELSAAEEIALKRFETLQWDAYNLEALFGKSTRGKRLKSADRLDGSLPFVTAGEACEGISAYIRNNVRVFAKNTTTIDMFGSAKYRNYSYGADDHVAVVHTEKLPPFAAMFVTAAIHKASHAGQFDYSKNFYAKDADALYIYLPTKQGGPDFETMELVISAMQKLVIQDVAMRADRRIRAAKEVVKRSVSSAE